MNMKFINSEDERWHQKYPRFPGVAKCVELLNSPKVNDSWLETVCGVLEEHAPDYGSELIEAARATTGTRAHCILLSILAEMKLPESISLFVDLLQSEDERARFWAMQGLRTLDTKEARRALWEAGCN